MRVRRAVVHRADVAGLRGGASGRRDPRIPFARPPVRRSADAGGRMTVVPTLSARTRLGIEVLAVGAAGGVIGDALLRAMPWGLNVGLGTAGLVGAGAWLGRRHPLTPGPDAARLPIAA